MPRRKLLQPSVVHQDSPPDLDPDLATLTLEEVARHLKVTQKTVRRWYALGQFPKPIRVGHRLRWPLVDLQLWMQNRRRAG